VKSGILGFDLLVGGGIPINHVILLQGPNPSDNAIFTNQFIKKGLDNFEPVLVVLSKISVEKFRENLKELGINAKKLERKGYLKIVDWYSFKSRDIGGDVEEKGGVIYASKDLTNLGIAINRGIKALKDAPVKRAVLDVLSPTLNFFEFKRIYNFIQSMVARFKNNDITTIFSLEIEAEGPEILSGLHGIFDGVVDLKVRREGDKLTRKIGIISMSDIHFDPKYRYYRIDKNQMIIYDKRGRSAPIKKPKKSKPIPWTLTAAFEGLSAKGRNEIKTKVKKVKTKPDDPKLWYALGTTLLSYNKFEDAIRAFDKVIDLDNTNIDAWTSKAEALTALGRQDEARACLEKIEKLTMQKDIDIKEKEMLKELESELHDVIGEQEQKEIEKPKEDVAFECPLCGGIVEKDAVKCPSCGVRFLEMEEVPEEVLSRKETEIEEIMFPSAAEDIFEELESELEKFEEKEEPKEVLEEDELESLISDVASEGINILEDLDRFVKKEAAIEEEELSQLESDLEKPTIPPEEEERLEKFALEEE
jgi:KaiC/GvpD/RAD55 family RecA-like ATPase/rubrerythrin